MCRAHTTATVQLCLLPPFNKFMSKRIVKLKQVYDRIVNPDMAKWIKENENNKFVVLDESATSAKLKGVWFRITLDLLEDV